MLLDVIGSKLKKGQESLAEILKGKSLKAFLSTLLSLTPVDQQPIGGTEHQSRGQVVRYLAIQVAGH